MDAKLVKDCTAIDALNPKKCAVFPQMVMHQSEYFKYYFADFFAKKCCGDGGYPLPNPPSLLTIFVGNEFANFGVTLPLFMEKNPKNIRKVP